MPIQLKLIRIYFQLLSIIAPKTAFKKASVLFQKVRKKDIRKREMEFFNNARSYTVSQPDEDINVHEYGPIDASPLLLVHGWESNPGSMSKIAELMTNKGYRVVAINLPGHGKTKSSSTNLHICKQAVEAVVSKINPSEPISVISHSFGSAVVSFAFADSNIAVNKLIYLTCNYKITTFFDEYKEMIKLGDKPYNMLLNWANSIVKEDITQMNMPEKIDKINYQDFMLIHDKKDKIINFSAAEKITSEVEDAILKSFTSIGHYRMLWNKDVLSTIDQFIPSKN